MKLNLLLIEDSLDDEELVMRSLSAAGFQLNHQRVETGETLRTALAQQSWDAVVSDYTLPRLDALQALDVVKESKLDLPFVVVSGVVSEDTALAAMRAGAHDYVMKSNLRRLPETLRREVREAKRRHEHRNLLASSADPDVLALVHLPFSEAKALAVGAFERRYLQALLDKTSGNISAAAVAAGMDRSNFRRLLKDAGLRKPKADAEQH